MDVRQLRIPIVQAPLAGGASTPALAAAVARAGGFGFLAAGYKTADALRADIRELRSLSGEPFGVNLFAPPSARPVDQAEIERYAARLAPEAARQGVELGVPRHDDDGFDAKLELLLEERVGVVSFSFGCPAAEIVGRCRDAGSDVWVTVTSPQEAAIATEAGADVLVVQGFEAGGHRGYFVDGPDAEDFGLLALLRLTVAAVDAPLVAAGGIADGAAVAAVLCAGAAAAQLGTALLLTPEAGTPDTYREALRTGGATALTRAFTGRQARGLVNRFMREHRDAVPVGYPDVHHLTAPIRGAAREQGDRDALHLWAGQAHALALEQPAEALVTEIATDARACLATVARRFAN